MQKKHYETPAMEVLSLGSKQEILQSSITLIAVEGADLSSPSEISGTWDSLFE